jgi:putative tricarboxylic transport membrane protein
MPLVKVFAKIIQTPAKYLLPMIIAISFFGVYAVQFSTFDLMLLLVCGVGGYLLQKNDFPLAPIVLGLVLGPMIENNMRRALTTSNGDFMVFLENPISLGFLLIAALWVIVPLIMKMKGKNIIINEEA